jgi:uncharacterized membrane protein YfcA
VTGPARTTLAVGALLTSTVLLVAVTFWLSLELADHGHRDLLAFDVEAIPVLATVVSASLVGAVLALRRPGHPVGWLFLALGTTVAASGVLDGYGGYGALVRGLPGSDLVP